MGAPPESCPTCGGALTSDYRTNSRHPVSGTWSVYEVVVCPGGVHAWGHWIEGDHQDGGGWNVGGRGGNAAHREAAVDGLSEEPDWTIRRRYGRVPQAQLRSDLVETVAAIGVHPVHKNTKFEDLARWVIENLPQAAPNDPRTTEALGMATYWWRYGR